jgi:hypothetical protein
MTAWNEHDMPQDKSSQFNGAQDRPKISEQKADMSKLWMKNSDETMDCKLDSFWKSAQPDSWPTYLIQGSFLLSFELQMRDK